MSQQTAWQTCNSAYLTASLSWLQLLLQLRIQSIAKASSSGSQPDDIHALTQEKDGYVQEISEPMLEEHIACKAEEIAALERSMQEAPPALIQLSTRLHLSRFEQNILLLCVAAELDLSMRHLYAQVQDVPGQTYPTFALAMVLFADPFWAALAPEQPLRYLQLIEIDRTQPLLTTALRINEYITHYIIGLSHLDERVASFVTPVDFREHEVAASQHKAVETIRKYWQQACKHTTSLPTIQLIGTDTASKQAVACHIVNEEGLQLYRMPIAMLPTQTAELEMLARLWKRESALHLLALYLDTQEGESIPTNEGQMVALNRFLVLSRSICFLGTRTPWSHLENANQSIEIEKPTLAEQQDAWAQALDEEEASISTRLAGQFDLSLTAIQQIAQSALDEDVVAQSPLQDRLWDACRMSVHPQLDALAQRLDPKATWDDIVLPEEEIRLLQQIVAQVEQRCKVYEQWGFARKMNRGLGINALFAGASGTGKTMAAEVLANALRLNLYRIDLSAVVSKYIGETEKNLRRLFDAAESGGTMLFFDEADALFGKRSEVKDSHDRFANIEINYLLQRMESYKGLAILATNMKSALDSAFMRRLRFIINFPFPSITERKQMWQKVFPQNTPLDSLDYDQLARLNLAGGSIHNIALNAAFLAASQGEDATVTMPLVLAAARTELRKLEQPIREADFQWYTHARRNL